MTSLQRLFLASPSHQLARIKHIAGRVRVKLVGEPDRFPNISMTEVKNVHRGTFDDGFVWHVTRDDKSLASWARTFIEMRIRFEDYDLIAAGDVVVNVGACTGEYTKYAIAAELKSRG